MSLDVIALPDGRLPEIEVSGPSDGVPWLWHHGTPGCSIQPTVRIQAAAAHGLRLVTCSRAGTRGSSRKLGRHVAEVAADMAAILDHLGTSRCLVGGESGGGPHALATDALLPERVAAVIVACGVRPFEPGFLDGMGEANRTDFEAALNGEEALTDLLVSESQQLADFDVVVSSMASLLSPADRDVIATIGPDLLAGLAGAVETIHGWLGDDLAFVQPWGFDLEALTLTVCMWQGTEDLMVPQAHMRWQAKRIPGAVTHLRPGEGHLSLQVNCLHEMLDEGLAYL